MSTEHHTMDRIIHLFSELQKELIAFVDKANRQLSTPRCDFACTHCNHGQPARKENYEEFSCKSGAITPDDAERFEQSELMISHVAAGNHVNNTRNTDAQPRTRVYLLSAADEVPEEMTISESSFHMEQEDGESENADNNERFLKDNEEADENEEPDEEEDAASRSLTQDGGKPDANVDKRRCKYCDRVFPFPYLVRRHEVVHTGLRPFRCLGCRLTFPHRSSLYAHQVHCQSTTLTCRQCGSKFRDAKKLKQHAARVHSKEATRPKVGQAKSRLLKCHICNRQCGNNSALQKHLAAHSDTKRFKCADCGKKYSYRERLKTHYRKCHSKSMPGGAGKKNV